MQNTTNLNLKKPEYTDFADIQDINDNMDTIDDAIHDTQNSVATFTSSDVADGSATSWTPVTKVDSGETHKSIFAKMSQMFKNIRFLYKMLGTTDISSIGNGTVTGGLSSLNDSSCHYEALSTFANGWITNGTCLMYQFGKLVCFHLSLRNGTKTDGTVILSNLNVSGNFVGPLVNREDGKSGYYFISGTNKTLAIYGVTSTNIMLDAVYVTS